MSERKKTEFPERKADRRINRELSRSPFETAAGVVAVDRRSHVEKRANWIGEFVLHQAEVPKQGEGASCEASEISAPPVAD